MQTSRGGRMEKEWRVSVRGWKTQQRRKEKREDEEGRGESPLSSRGRQGRMRM
jgi:hypothetical protein